MSCLLTGPSYYSDYRISLEDFIDKIGDIEVIFQDMEHDYILVDESGEVNYLGGPNYLEGGPPKIVLLNKIHKREWKRLVRDKKLRELGI